MEGLLHVTAAVRHC